MGCINTKYSEERALAVEFQEKQRLKEIEYFKLEEEEKKNYQEWQKNTLIQGQEDLLKGIITDAALYVIEKNNAKTIQRIFGKSKN
jgi:hypothetical protein